MKRITLIASEVTNTWCAQFEGDNTKELFGTDTLPTPYTLAMPVSEILRRIKARNPEYRVRVDLR